MVKRVEPTSTSRESSLYPVRTRSRPTLSERNAEDIAVDRCEKPVRESLASPSTRGDATQVAISLCCFRILTATGGDDDPQRRVSIRRDLKSIRKDTAVTFPILAKPLNKCNARTQNWSFNRCYQNWKCNIFKIKISRVKESPHFHVSVMRKLIN